MKRLLHGEVAVGESLPRLSMDMHTTRIVAGALASRDYTPLHHDFHYATEQAGHPDIFMNTFHQAALFERLLGDWSGPRGRLGRMKFKMSASVYAGDRVTVDGTVTAREVDARGCGWVTLDLRIAVDDRTCTGCEARYALPISAQDNPWRRRDEDWQP